MQSSLQQVLVRVERLRSENKELSEKAASLVQEKLNIEQTLQKKKASHEQTLERLRQVGGHCMLTFGSVSSSLAGAGDRQSAAGAGGQQGGGGGRQRCDIPALSVQTAHGGNCSAGRKDTKVES